ncbi:phosphatase PAP2 family protein [Arthrobacter sp. M4]|uniref:phosphatase PAP2 family protein n=1 Tax=Arthrobacter sp. M4 TaxID=218160 RepID=UPI001CDC6343|nr:phosphatase PAP2 family protein [Arthrobacter sp. M4]MCA4133257.1 phosphatase PAP2 family protein [Arthrobacter sp. M4]
MARLFDPRPLPVGATVAVGSTLLLALAVPGFLLAADPLNVPFIGLDSDWHQWVEDLRTPFWDGVNAVLNWLGYTGAFAAHVLLSVFLMLRRRPFAAAFVATAGFAALGLTQLAKWLVGRPRPADAVVLTDTGSYPSGHVSATTAFVVVLALMVARAWLWILSTIGVLAMMFSRTYLAAHWLTDTFAGAAIAAVVVLLIWLAFQKVCVRENTDARRMLTWLSRAGRRRRAAAQGESAPQ